MSNLNSKAKDEIMDMKILNSGGKKRQTHSHAKHMWMMAICCGLPILGFLAIGVIGISMPSLETVLLLICPIGMIGMMYMMHRDSQQKENGNSCCDSGKSAEEPAADTPHEIVNDSERDLPKPQQPGSLEA